MNEQKLKPNVKISIFSILLNEKLRKEMEKLSVNDEKNFYDS